VQPNALKRRFEQIAVPQMDSVYRMARRLTRHDAEADDLIQETFLRAYRAFATFELREYGIKPWLLRILHNLYYTGLGRQRREPTLLADVDLHHAADELDAESTGGEITLDWDKYDQELKRAVLGLQPEYRVVLLLWAVEELSYKEIAQVCECPIGTVMSRLYRARQILGRQLAEFARGRNVSLERFAE